MVARRTLYPPPQPFDHGFLERGQHRIYYEQCGNPDGKAALFVHGGPGGGDPEGRRFFDPQAYRLVYFEQRGAGRSQPAASLDGNTTWHLVADIEALRDAMQVDKWLVFGGSWGSTLALAYAETHPQAVSELVLRGIFLLRRQELDWFYQSGASYLFPDEWQRFTSLIPPDERRDLLAAYHRRLTGEDEDLKLAAAKAWSIWEGATSSLLANAERVERYSAPTFALAFARIETHYFINRGFFDSETQLLDDVDRIRHIPGVIVHGRYDVVCPLATAWELSRRWPEARLRVVADAGHSAYEPGITHELVCATDEFSRRR
ncbi:MAG TPA: prolyl aminopeptidase [Gammaproteobacteria bacterium]|jgi:proline iminopeptidase